MSSKGSMQSVEKSIQPTTNRKLWSRKRRILVGIGTISIILVIALAVGLSAGHSHQHNYDSNKDNGSADNSNSINTSDNPSSTSTPSTPNNNSNTTTTNTMWQPALGSTWQYVLKWPLTSTLPNATQIWDIDLFDNTRATITGLQTHGAKVICYFSAGSYENWRPDKSKWFLSDLGHELDGWPDERWANISSPRVRKVMLARLDLAVMKGCNGVDPDNIDGYDNDNGLGLTKAQSVDYVKFLASAAHTRGLSIGLKNGGDIVTELLPYMQWSVNEQCVQYDECNLYQPFVAAGKPVFNVEYPKGDDTNNQNNVSAATKASICSTSRSYGFSTIIKNMILDMWKESC